MPTLWMLIGVPAAGKSTWIATHHFDWNNTVLISTDNIIDQRAASQNKTYSQVFQSEIKSATTEMNTNLRNAIANNENIVWDQTNVTASARKKKLALIPDDYHKIAVFFKTPDTAELTRRLDSRVGKTIPHNIVHGMISQLEPPGHNEGFDEIITV